MGRYRSKGTNFIRRSSSEDLMCSLVTIVNNTILYA